jgi:hypothetical protein
MGQQARFQLANVNRRVLVSVTSKTPDYKSLLTADSQTNQCPRGCGHAGLFGLLGNRACRPGGLLSRSPRRGLLKPARLGRTLPLPLRLRGFRSAGLGLTLADCGPVNDFISDHWSRKSIDRLDEALSSLMARYGNWLDISEFAVLERLAEDLLQEGGVFMSPTSGDGVYITVPFPALPVRVYNRTLLIIR